MRSAYSMSVAVVGKGTSHLWNEISDGVNTPYRPPSFPTYKSSKMKVSRQPRISALLRVFAGTGALLWFVGTAVYGIVCVCNCAGHKEACAASASAVHEHAAEAHQHATASHHDDREAPQGHCGKNGCEDKCRCSTIQGFVQTPLAVVIPKPVSQPVLIISILCAVRQHVFAAPPSETLRRAKPRDWVFTPEVCLGPAFRSHAPPASV